MKKDNHIVHSTGPHKSIEIPLDGRTLDEYKAMVDSWGVKYGRAMKFKDAVYFENVKGSLENIPSNVLKCTSFWVYMKK